MSTDKTQPPLTWNVRSPADLGRALSGVRRRRGLTQAELAAELDIDRTYLARLEAGASPLAVARIVRALRRMGATITISEEDDGREG